MLFILDRSFNVIDNLSITGDISKMTPFFDDLLTEDLASGAETYKFEIQANLPQASSVTVGNYIAFRQEKDFKLFTIIETDESHSQDNIKSVYCEMTSIELINNELRPNKYVSVTAYTFLESILANTDWQLGIRDIGLSEVKDIDITDYTSVYEAIQEHIVKGFGAEIRYRVEIQCNTIVGKFIDIFIKRGKISNVLFSYTKNMTSVSRKTNLSNLVTALIGVGKNNITFRDIETPTKPAGQDFIASEEAYRRWNRKGKHIIGTEKFDTESEHELLKLTAKKLEERINPQVKYELKVELLGDKVAVGDTVRVVDHDFNPPLYLEARVSQLKTSQTNPQNDEVVLSNFKEINSNISDEMRQIANQLEGYVDGQFPIGGDKIQDGAIDGDKLHNGQIIQGTHLFANSVTADKIKAGSIETDHLSASSVTADKVTTGELITKSAQIKDAVIDSAHIKEGTIDSVHINDGAITQAKIGDAQIGTAQIKDAEITVAKIESAFIDKIVAKEGKFDSAHIGVLTSENINAETIKANVIDAINLNVEGKISADRIDVSKITVDEIDAGKITSGSIDTDRLTSSVIQAINASIESATINSAKIGDLSADKITSGEISTDILKSNIISAINASIGKITAEHIDVESIVVDNIDAGSIVSGTIDAQRLTVSVVQAINLSAAQIDAKNINVDGLKVGGANILEGSITNAHIGNGQIGNAQIDKAFIADGYIKKLDASKITSGTIDTAKVTVSSTAGNLSIANNTMQIKDTNKTVRVQLGQDATGDYGLIVQNAQGQVMWDLTGASKDGIQNGAIVNDKIKDNEITADKLVIDSIWANEAFISNFQSQNIDAGQITTGKITGEYIDISGLVGFDALDPSISENFRPARDEDGNITKTWINGANIFTGSVTADKINTRGFTSQDDNGNVTFNIDSKTGEVNVRGNISSINYEEGKEGYKLEPNGEAEFNNSILRGSVILPTAGLTNFGSNSNNLVRSTYDFSQYWGNVTDKITEGLYGAKAIINKRTDWSAGTPRQQIVSTLDSSVKSGDTITLSGYYWVDSSVTTSGDINNNNIMIRVYEEGTTNFKDMCPVPIEVTKTNQWIRFEATGVVPYSKIRRADLVFSVHTNGYFKLTLPKVEFGEKAHNWAPSALDNLNITRIWAGASYENREKAPFRVLQDGSVIATKGDFGGTITGKLNIGNIHIEDTNATNGFIDIKTNNDTETKVHLEENNSYIKSNLLVGNNFVNFDSTKNLLQIKGIQTLSNGNILITLNDGTNILQTSDSKGTHLQRYNDGTLIFEAQGTNTFGDYLFKRMDQPVDVRVDGNVYARDKITMNNNIAIVARQDAGNSGFDYVVK